MPRFRPAIFTIVANERDFLPHWLAHYINSAGFPAEDVYVLDHGTVGDADIALRAAHRQYNFNLLTVRHTYAYDAGWLALTVRLFQAWLLQSYDMAMFLAADEFLLATDGVGAAPLLPYLERSSEVFIRATGYEVLHGKTEPSLPPIPATLLGNRQWWNPTRRFSKPVAARTPLVWLPGLATATNFSPAQPADPALLLLHLAKVDYDWRLRHNREVAAREWRPGSRRDSPYRHHLIEDPESLRRWMESDADDPTKPAAAIDRIPKWVQDAI